jgi:hypothetical protein
VTSRGSEEERLLRLWRQGTIEAVQHQGEKCESKSDLFDSIHEGVEHFENGRHGRLDGAQNPEKPLHHWTGIAGEGVFRRVVRSPAFWIALQAVHSQGGVVA